MPAPRVHAIVVARADSRTLGLTHFRETLDALHAQTVPVDAFTIVLCGNEQRFAAVANESGAATVLQMDLRTSFATAVAQAARHVDADVALWLLAQDTTPEPEALQELTGQLDLGPSVAVVAPRLVRRDAPSILASLGISMTAGGRAVELAAGQFDQGQHDGRTDVLGADVRGMLLRNGLRESLLPDPALAGADEGLDMGVRSHLNGHRVVTAPRARMTVAGDAVAGLPDATESGSRARVAYAQRVAQLHRRLAYAPAALVPMHILSFIPLLIWRAITGLADKQPWRVLPEAWATIVAGSRWGAIARSRAKVTASREGWQTVNALRITKAQRRILLSSDTEDIDPIRTDLRFFSGGGAWAVLASLVASVAMFPMLLGWPVIGGGALLPLRTDLTQLWADAAYGLRGYGLERIAAADPFAAVVAVLGSLSPSAPSLVLIVLWVLAMPLATLGAWFATTRFTERSGLRLLGAAAWTIAPSFLNALIDPRPTAVLVHILLPWLLFVGVVVHRSWGYAGTASLLLAVIAACSPSLGAVLIVIAVIGVIAALVQRRFAGAGRTLWSVVPAIIIFLPLLWQRLVDGNPFAILTDPGVQYQGVRAAQDLAGRVSTMAGDLTGTQFGWPQLLGSFGMPAHTVAAIAPFVLLLLAPMVVLALAAAFTPRWRVSVPLLVTAAGFAVAAVLAAQTSFAVFDGAAIAIAPGPLVSAAWLLVIAAALVTLDEWRRPAALSAVAAVLAGLALVVAALPLATTGVRDQQAITSGPASTLPAYVAASLQDGKGGATLVLTMLDDGSVSQRIVWGASDTLGAQSTVLATRQGFDAEDTAIADVVADLITPESEKPLDLASVGIRFVLLEPVAQDSGDAAVRRAQATSALDQRAGLLSVGETGKGALWQIEEVAAPMQRDARHAIAVAIGIGSLAVLVLAILVALPTRASMRTAQTRPRAVGVKGEAR